MHTLLQTMGRMLCLLLLATFAPANAHAEVCDASARVREIVVAHLGVDASKVADTTRLVDDLEADELDQLELVMAWELEFNCAIPDDVAETFLTVGDARRFLQANCVTPPC